ncbi:MAG: glycosyltransferase family protein [Planctomycetota bacterium]|jgi:hypothetical protein
MEICISTRSITNDNHGIGAMLSDVFSKLNFQTSVVEDGDPSALDADILFLAGDGLCFKKYSRLFRKHIDSRPTTILWLLDPLLPPEFNQEAIEISLQLAKWSGTDSSSSCATVLKYLTPFSNKIQKNIRRRLMRKIQKVCKDEFPKEYWAVRNHRIVAFSARYAWIKQNLKRGWIDYVFVSTKQREQFLRKVGIESGYIPFGYHPHWGQKLETKRDIDVLFIGKLKNNRRRSILKTIENELSAHNIKIVVIDQSCYGQKRTKLLNQTRIVLDIIRVPWEMSMMRLMMSMGCGALVVSNWVGHIEPLTNKHLVQAKNDKIAEVIRYYLDNKDERKVISEAAYKFVTQNLTLKNSISKIMEKVMYS